MILMLELKKHMLGIYVRDSDMQVRLYEPSLDIINKGGYMDKHVALFLKDKTGQIHIRGSVDKGYKAGDKIKAMLEPAYECEPELMVATIIKVVSVNMSTKREVF